MIQKYFETITDKRQEWKTKHNLPEIIIMTICSVIAECEAWYQIEGCFGEKAGWFREKLGLKLEHVPIRFQARLLEPCLPYAE